MGKFLHPGRRSPQCRHQNLEDYRQVPFGCQMRKAAEHKAEVLEHLSSVKPGHATPLLVLAFDAHQRQHVGATVGPSDNFPPHD